MRPSPPVSAIAVLLLCGAVLSGPALAAEPAPGGAGGAAAVAAPNVVKFAKGLTVASLAGRPDSDLIEFANGRRVTIQVLRDLAAIQAELRSARPGSKRPAAFSILPNRSAIAARLAAAPDLAAALERPNADTVQLPSGRLATVEQIKFVMPKVEQRLGRSLAGPAPLRRPGAEGTVVSKRTTKAEWEAILAKPDGTVVQSADGKHRVTVGQLKQFRGARQTAPKGVDGGSVPLVPFAGGTGGPK